AGRGRWVRSDGRGAVPYPRGPRSGDRSGDQNAAGLEVRLPRPLSSPIERIGVPQALGEQLHQLQREVRVLPNEDVELRLVDLDEFSLLERDYRGCPRRVLQERHLAEDLLISQDTVFSPTRIATRPVLMANMLSPGSPSRKIVVPIRYTLLCGAFLNRP